MNTYQEQKRQRSLYQLHRRAVETSQAMVDAREDRNDTIVQLREQGVTLRKIGELVGLTHVAVLRIEQAAEKGQDNA
jgi:DNA-directed RNA polymerase specialized sigma subunit